MATIDVPVLIFPRSWIGSHGADYPFSGPLLHKQLSARPNYLFSPAARGLIAGTVKKDSDPADLPLRRRVRLYRDRDGMLIGETWSDAVTGQYRFEWIEEAWAYTVIAYDYELNYRAVVADNLTPELMP